MNLQQKIEKIQYSITNRSIFNNCIRPWFGYYNHDPILKSLAISWHVHRISSLRSPFNAFPPSRESRCRIWISLSRLFGFYQVGSIHERSTQQFCEYAFSTSKNCCSSGDPSGELFKPPECLAINENRWKTINGKNVYFTVDFFRSIWIMSHTIIGEFCQSMKTWLDCCRMNTESTFLLIPLRWQ